MREKLYSIPRIVNLLSNGEAEIVNCWIDEDTGVYCKGKTDYVKEENGRKILIDIKTTQDHSQRAFMGSCYKYGYDRQSAFYMDGFGCDEFVFITQEKERPYNVSIFYAGDEFIERGRHEYKYLLDIYKKFFIDNDAIVEEHLIIETL